MDDCSDTEKPTADMAKAPGKEWHRLGCSLSKIEHEVNDFLIDEHLLAGPAHLNVLLSRTPAHLPRLATDGTDGTDDWNVIRAIGEIRGQKEERWNGEVPEKVICVCPGIMAEDSSDTGQPPDINPIVALPPLS